MHKSPHYNLELVQEAARAKRVYPSRSAQRDYQNLDLTFEEVCECLASLQASGHKQTLLYEDSKQLLDVFHMKRPHGTGVDVLYIKLAIRDGEPPVVMLNSFHRHR